MKMIFMVLIIAAIIFWVTSRRLKKFRESNQTSAIDDYRKNYTECRKRSQEPAGTNNYVTKYNSKMDYREK